MKHDPLQFATRPAILRSAIDTRRNWIEIQLGAPLSECVIIEVATNLAQVALDKVLCCAVPRESTPRIIRRMRPFVTHAQIPAKCPPMVAMTKAIPGVGTPTLSQAMRASKRIRTTALEWLDCPVAMFIQGIPSPIIAWNISYHRGPYAAEEDVANLLITRRDCTEQVVKFVAELERSDRQPRLCTLRGDTRTIARCKWEQMTLDPQVVSLLKDDFDFFF